MYSNQSDARPFVAPGASVLHSGTCIQHPAALSGHHLGAKSMLLAAGMFAAAVCMLFSQSASAQELPRLDPSSYAALADVDSSATIPPGTRITLENWQRYKSFLPLGLQELYSQKLFWKVGAGPDFAVEVGPTSSIPMPKKYADDTEKGAGQAKLVPAATGGYNIANYHAGLPFPNRTAPWLGIK